MKGMIYATLMLLAISAQAQFHVRVTCNPDNDGQTNTRWLNNYVVEYTGDNWQHSNIIQGQLTYSGFRDDGTTFYVSYYQKSAFQKLSEAVAYAKHFTSIEYIHEYDSLMLQRHQQLSASYALQNKKHPIGTKKPADNSTCKQVAVY